MKRGNSSTGGKTCCAHTYTFVPNEMHHLHHIFMLNATETALCTHFTLRVLFHSIRSFALALISESYESSSYSQNVIHQNHDLTSDLARIATHETVFNYDEMINELFLAPINKNLSQYDLSLFAKIGQLLEENKNTLNKNKIIFGRKSLFAFCRSIYHRFYIKGNSMLYFTCCFRFE